MKIKILFINLPSSLASHFRFLRKLADFQFRYIPLHSSVTKPASFLFHEEKSARKPGEILIKKSVETTSMYVKIKILSSSQKIMI